MLPTELIEEMLLRFPFEKVVSLPFAKKLYNPKIHTWNWTASHGHLEVDKFLHENRSEGRSAYAINHAAKNGHLEIVKFLKEHYPNL